MSSPDSALLSQPDNDWDHERMAISLLRGESALDPGNNSGAPFLHVYASISISSRRLIHSVQAGMSHSPSATRLTTRHGETHRNNMIRKDTQDFLRLSPSPLNLAQETQPDPRHEPDSFSAHLQTLYSSPLFPRLALMAHFKFSLGPSIHDDDDEGDSLIQERMISGSDCILGEGRRISAKNCSKLLSSSLLLISTDTFSCGLLFLQERRFLPSFSRTT